ncbi:MAG: thioredoxin domain-containing protein [Nitrospinaceae bacterium]|nr:thioredoxin domain-containing protein [Nitrospinaceae bacterium]NIR56420.1 thioredoxin domain-containing protein [Nitrospinaceae bacterium]NIS86884.1 thioredoxin domain-containing protein [Nitrospinaceae bacterium]NIT83720.1 thioredoxin domain-containing protein [Nitrospinaceae bacterium]NIU45921.1 thioredoxin domain-containing protein [Nitrospinaceae bacterium]
MKTVSALILAFALILPAAWAGEKPRPIKGKYEVVGNLSKLKNIKQIEMIEFFNYSCGHCYRFLQTSKRLHKKYKGKLHHIKYPIYFEKQNPYPAMAYYIADEQGVEKKFTNDLFYTNFELSTNIFQPRVIKILAREHGIEKEMTAGMQSPIIKAKVQRSMDLSNQYKTRETPTIIINKTLKVAPSIAGGNVDKMTDNLEIIFDDLLKR